MEALKNERLEKLCNHSYSAKNCLSPDQVGMSFFRV